MKDANYVPIKCNSADPGAPFLFRLNHKVFKAI